MNWIWIENYRVYASVSACLSNFYLASGLSEFFFKQLTNKVFEILPIHRSKIRFRFDTVGDSV